MGVHHPHQDLDNTGWVCGWTNSHIHQHGGACHPLWQQQTEYQHEAIPHDVSPHNYLTIPDGTKWRQFFILTGVRFWTMSMRAPVTIT